MRLTREVRFSVGSPATGPIANSWGGWPSATGVQPYVVLRCRVEGEPDPTTGYLCNITVIDRLVRDKVIPHVNHLVQHGPIIGERLIRAVADLLRPLPPAGARWFDWQVALTPWLYYRVAAGDMHMVDIQQMFEFSAAHRLHCPSLSDERNREIFGKCNNPTGHGHNYAVEITLTGEPDATGVLLPVGRFEQTVKERVIDQLDHKHLNADCPAFADLNPSVENIARVIWGFLDGRLAPARLKRVRVWETPKTCAEYEGPGDRA